MSNDNSNNQIPLIISASQLEQELQNSTNTILLVDMGSPTSYIQNHIPSAVFLDYSWIVRIEPPRMGLIPNEQQLNAVFNSLGLSDDTHVIAYDDEGGGRACRLLWTLESIGHKHYSLLDGGIQDWMANNHAVTNTVSYPSPCDNYQSSLIEEPVANQAFIREHLDDSNVVILDSRSVPEYTGQKAFAERGGHIPGAVNWEWTEAMDKSNNLRLKSQAELSSTLEALGITKDKLIITHCQTHHRSAHTYIVLKSLGYEQIKGYPGSWSDWGNTADSPIEL